MRIFSAGMAALFLCNCAPKNLYVAHETVLGLNAKVNQARQQGQLLFGYDRDFVTVIPTQVKVLRESSEKSSEKSEENQSFETDAMALVHCTRLMTDGIYLGEYTDFTATGVAADLVAQAPERVRAATSCDQLAGEDE